MPLAYDLYHGFSIQILLKEIAFITPENLIEQRKRNYQEENAPPRVVKMTFGGPPVFPGKAKNSIDPGKDFY
jgi:hypothetical protein